MKRFTALERKYVREVLDGEFAASKNGIFNERLEAACAELFDVPFAIGHINGTATMHTALAAWGIGAGDEVIVPPLTMSSTAIAVLHCGAVPVFADVDKETFNIDPIAVKKAVTPRTKAIISVALYGLAPDYDGLLKICKAKKMALIEDDAQCFLGTYKGTLAGRFGHFSSFSFQASKHLTCGEGGMLLCRDKDLADKARKFHFLGFASANAKKSKTTRNRMKDPYYDRHVSLGFNYRMSELQAAVALGQLERAKELVAQRQKVAAIFDHAIGNSPLLIKQAAVPDCINTYWSYSAVLNTKHPAKDWYRFGRLFQRHGGDGFYAAWKLSYKEPLFQNEVQKMKGVRQRYTEGLCPTAEYLQPRLIQLKTNYWDLAEAERQGEILAKTIRKFE